MVDQLQVGPQGPTTGGDGGTLNLQGGRQGDLLFMMMKNVDIAGETRAIAVQGGRARDVALRTPMRREGAEDITLQVRERHGTLARCARRGGGRSDCLPTAGSRRSSAPG